MNRISRAAKALTVTSVFGAAALVAPAADAADAKPGAPAAKPDSVHATAHLAYTIKGMTVTLRPWVTGTQHRSVAPEDGQIVSSDLPSLYEVKVPEGAVATGGGLAGQSGLGCDTKGSVALNPRLLSGEPIVLTFKKAGTYTVSMHTETCTEPMDTTVSLTFTLPAKPGAPVSAKPPVPAKPAKTGMGPKVETDKVDDGASNLPLGLAGLAGMGAIGGVAAVRRRTQG